MSENVKNEVEEFISTINSLTCSIDNFNKKVEIPDVDDKIMLSQQINHLKYLTKILTKIQNLENLENLEDEIDIKHK